MSVLSSRASASSASGAASSGLPRKVGEPRGREPDGDEAREVAIVDGRLCDLDELRSVVDSAGLEEDTRERGGAMAG